MSTTEFDKPRYLVAGTTNNVPRSLVSADEAAPKLNVAAERLLDLAEYLPHWRIDGGEPLFSLGEVREWIHTYLYSRHEGAPLQTKFFLVSDRPPVEGHALPKAVRDIRGLIDITDVSSGIYLLFHRGRVVYVGQAAVAARRIAEHVGNKEFDQVLFLPWPRWDLDKIESALIRLLEPPLNQTCTSGLRPQDVELLTLVRNEPGATQATDCAQVT